MKGKACIYCGTTIDLTESDIIPDALTNARILNPNVCHVAHNSRFSDMFEDEVIRKLAVITNLLDIKSRKAKNYSKYHVKFTVDGEEYSADISSESELFKHIHTSTDKTTKIGPLEKIENIPRVPGSKIEQIDINTQMVEKELTIDLQVFFSDAMFRLISKIAYEWYCLHNNVYGVIEQFNPIIEYITTGKGANPVNFIESNTLYDLLSEDESFGSHTLIAYVGADNSVNVIVCLFGIAIYNVRLLPNTIESCKNNCIFQELSLDSNRTFFSYESINELFEAAISPSNNASVTNIKLPMFNIDAQFAIDVSYYAKVLYLESYPILQNTSDYTLSPTSKACNLLLDRIKFTLQQSALTVRGLKRFIKENQLLEKNELALNPNGTDKKEQFLYYVLFLTGIFNFQSFAELNQYLSQQFKGRSLDITDEMSKSFSDSIFSVNGYPNILKGAAIIDKWDS